MPVPDSDVLSVLEWGLGVAISLYGGTAFLLFNSRKTQDDRLEDEIKDVDKRIESAVKRLHERIDQVEVEEGKENTRLWEEVTQQRRDTARYQETILTTMATKQDLRDHETRMTAAIAGAIRQVSS